MTPFVRTDGPIGGHLPRTEKPVASRAARYTGPSKPESAPDWRDQAVCANTSQIDLWFPGGNTGAWLVQIEAAKTACRRCPVLANCEELLADMQRDLGDALAGVWAATSESDRTEAARRRRSERDRARAKAKRQVAA